MRPPTLSQLFLSLLHSVWCQQITLSIFVGRSCLKYWCVVSCWSYCLLLLYHAIVAILNSASKPWRRAEDASSLCIDARCSVKIGVLDKAEIRQNVASQLLKHFLSHPHSVASTFSKSLLIRISLGLFFLQDVKSSLSSSSFQAFVQALTMCCTELPVQECALSAQNTCDCGRSCCPGRGLADGLQGLGFRRVSRQKGHTRAAIATGMGRYILFSLNLKNVLDSSWPWASETF